MKNIYLSLIMIMTVVCTVAQKTTCMQQEGIISLATCTLIPLVQDDNDPLLTATRQIIDNDLDFTQKIPNLVRIDRETPLNRFGTCGDWAFNQILKTNTLRITGTADWTYYFLRKHEYFEQTQNPSSGDLAAYASDSLSCEPVHFGVVVDNNTIRSKWGIRSQVWQHPPFYVPSTYGKVIYFFSLTDKYKNNPKLLLADIKHDISQSPMIEKRLKRYRCSLFALARGQYTQLLEREKKLPIPLQVITELIKLYNKHNPCRIAKIILKVVTHIKLTICERKTGQNLLMFAAQRNDLSMALLLVQYGIDANQKDLVGNTALMLAQQTNSSDVAQYLQTLTTVNP